MPEDKLKPFDSIPGHDKYRINGWVYNVFYNSSNYGEKWEIYKGEGRDWMPAGRFRTKAEAVKHLEGLLENK